jgi:hypothetical protein
MRRTLPSSWAKETARLETVAVLPSCGSVLVNAIVLGVASAWEKRIDVRTVR